MLFQSQVPIIFSRLNLQADSATSLARKTETAKRLDLYHDAQLEHLETRLNELFSDPSAMVKTCLNVVKKVIVNLAQVYREAPVRIIEGTDSDKELYSGILESMGLDMKLKQASRYSKLLKTILLRPVWRNERLDLDILTGNILDVETGESPEILSRVLVTDYGVNDKIQEIEYSLWTPEIWQRLDYRGQEIESAANPYGVLPFLSVFDYPPPSSSFWLPGGDDLVSLQEAINLKLTDLLYLLSTQSFGVGYIKGGQGGGSLKVDPGALVELQENGEIGFANQQARIEEVVGAIDKLIKWCEPRPIRRFHVNRSPGSKRVEQNCGYPRAVGNAG